jgi:signal transduction histidine kinase
MARVSTRLVLYLVFDFLLLFISFYNFENVYKRPAAPFETEWIKERLVISKINNHAACSSLTRGDVLLRWNNSVVMSSGEVEFISDLASIGDRFDVMLERNGEVISDSITLIPYYHSPRFAIIMSLVGAIIWCMALFVAVSRLDGYAAYALHWGLITLALSLLLTQGSISLQNHLSVVYRIGFLIAYISSGGFFFFFSLVYPKNKYGSVVVKSVVIGGVVLLIMSVAIYTFLLALYSPSAIHYYIRIYEIYHIVITFLGIGIIASIFDSYIRATLPDERSRLQWILWGIVVGIVPFLIFILIPQILLSEDLIPEEYATVFLLATPFSFAISFVRYQLFDVHVVIRRSIIYSIMTVFIIVIYILFILLGTSIIGGEVVFSQYLLPMLITVIMAMVFHPLRVRLQRVVDSTLFPARVFLTETVARISVEFQNILTLQDLADRIVPYCTKILPYGTFAFYLEEANLFQCKAAQGIVSRPTIRIPESISGQILNQATTTMHTFSKSVYQGHVSDQYRGWLLEMGFTFCIPVISKTGGLRGLITCTSSVRGERYTWEEIELLNALAVQAAETIDRLLLQKKIIMEQEERLRIEELNRLKSYFVSSVSHELRTPLTSIQLFAETLKKGKIKSQRKKKEYYDIIYRESERLSRLIDSVLDFSRVERGTKEYHFTLIDPQKTIRNAVDFFQNQLKGKGVRLTVQIAKPIPPMWGDRDALEEVVINLLSNAVKFSQKGKMVTLRLYAVRDRIILVVEDKGIGIPEKDLSKIFEPFYRVRTDQQIPGMGLGLQLVKHIIDAHHGTIDVASTPGKGSRFTVSLPRNSDNGEKVKP